MHVVHALNRSWLRIAFLSLCLTSLSTIIMLSACEASPSPASFDVKIRHSIDLREGGLLIVSDTVTLSTLTGDTADVLPSYSLGFPFGYRSDLAYAFAYENSNQSSRLNLDLNAGIGMIGFYGVKVDFVPPVDIGNEGSYKFTVIFVFSNNTSFNIASSGTTVFYNASFPAYPSLPDVASEVNVEIAMPTTLNYNGSSYESEGINLTQKIEGPKRILSFAKSNLSAFSDHPAWCYASRARDGAQLLDFEEFERRIEIMGDERIQVSDSYKLLNKAGQLTKVQLRLPRGVDSVVAYDEFGLVQESNLKIQQTPEYTNANITLTTPRDEKDEVHLSLRYELPWKSHIALTSFDEFRASLSLFENTDGVIRKSTTTIVLPEGAVLSSLTDQSLNSLQNTAFTASFILVFENATPFHVTTLNFAYHRPALWNSFRPTLWMDTFIFVVAALVAVSRVYRPSVVAPLPAAVVTIRADDLRSFVTNYDERRRLLKEAGSLESASQKGKIPRRQYKVRKMTIDGRLASLSRDLVALRDKLRMAGPRYTELMRQLEIAETELQGAEAEIDRAEVRYRRGDLSPQSYHNVLETSYRRRDRAQTTIDGVLLRLREEII
jgi:hypothetical protein